jgi:hypothetical protein
MAAPEINHAIAMAVDGKRGTNLAIGFRPLEIGRERVADRLEAGGNIARDHRAFSPKA